VAWKVLVRHWNLIRNVARVSGKDTHILLSAALSIVSYVQPEM
jgi:hypothetical protein